MDYAAITATGDRSHTRTLLARLRTADLNDDELRPLTIALAAASDPRAIAPLKEILADAAARPELRRAVGRSFGDWQYDGISDAQWLAWWRAGDPVLREIAFAQLGMVGREEVLAVANDPSHPLHRDAIVRLRYGFESPAHQRVKIAALAHSDPRVREAAAYALVYDEPVCAEDALLAATRDPDPGVVAEACYALGYYLTRRVYVRLDALREHPDARVREQLTLSLDALRDEFVYGAREPEVGASLRAWMEPIEHILAFTEDELRPFERAPPPIAAPAKKLGPPSLDAVVACLEDEDATVEALRALQRETDWRAFSAGEREVIVRAFERRYDPVRTLVECHVARCWEDVARLMARADHGDFIIRKHAMYELGELAERRPEVAALAWRMLAEIPYGSVHATETLHTYARHAPPDEAPLRLYSVAADEEQPESLRLEAVYHLDRLRARRELTALAHLLERPPPCTWAFHVALIEALVRVGVAPRVDHLRAVDHLHVQRAVALAQRG